MIRAALFAWALSVTAGAAQDATRVTGAPPSCIGGIVRAAYGAPTTRYDHAVLGDGVEWGALTVVVRGNGTCRWGTSGVTLTLPDTMVFEDTEPRLADITGDGSPEVITVETHLDLGARLTVWGVGPSGVARIAVTPFIGRPRRWLAPVGAADLDGDGAVEIAYVDRPHLARELVIWRYDSGRFTEITRAPGLTNHRIGETDIAGGIRDCGGDPEIVTADAGWQNVVATRLVEGRLTSRAIAPHRDRKSFAAAMACD